MCERFHCLPSQLDAEDAEFLRMISMINQYGPQEEVDDYGE